MKLYMEKYGFAHRDFAPFAITAHNNGNLSQHAVFHKKPLTEDDYEGAMMVIDPIQVAI